MDGNPYRTEGQRLLGVAEKLLHSGDLNGSRDFAILAQETDPLLEGSDQILAIVDVLLAAEKRVNNIHHDWYSILQLDPRTNDQELIKKQYRRLALLLHPDKNRFPYAEHAFRFVAAAWAVLSDPARKPIYDRELGFFTRIDLGNPSGSGGGSGSGSGSGSGGASGNSGGGVQGGKLPVWRSNSEREGVSGSGIRAQAQAQPQQQFQFQFGGQNVVAADSNSNNININNDYSTTTTTNHGNVNVNINPSVNVNSHGNRGSGRNSGGGSRSEKALNFWCACPFCYMLHEYPKVYEDCCLRCQNCRRAFHAVEIKELPPLVEGEDAYRCCWGTFPMGFVVGPHEGGGKLPFERQAAGAGAAGNTAAASQPTPAVAVPVNAVASGGRGGGSVGQTPQVKRKRGRPRKNPL